MPLQPGQRLAHYRVLEKIGEGGMGEVYRAEDTKLGRSVAIKVLPEAFVQDRGRLARFSREAQILASLNHPNIAGIYGLEEGDDITALALELVEGETLAGRLARGPIPVDETVPVAMQIAEALAAAHERNIVHRDLKPSNIKFAADGRAKILDFGLAKALAESSTGIDPSLSPTLTTPGTMAGVILGTAAYMSPEQARGRPVDRRADVWAFGAVLFEMLAGRALFQGESVSEIMAEVLKTEPDWSALPPETPTSVRRLLQRCLTRDPAWRLADMSDARLDLKAATDDEAAGPAGTGSAPALTIASSAGGWPALAVAILVAVLATATAGWLALRPAPPEPSLSLEINLPPGMSLDARPVIAPDGRAIAYVASGGGRGTRLFIRHLSGFESREIGEAATPGSPFFSPDSRWVGYIGRGALWKVAVEGGTPVRLADSQGHFGGDWGPDETIVFVPSLGNGLHLLRAGDRTARQVTRPDGGPTGYAHVFPQFLPDGRILYTVWGEPDENNFVFDPDTDRSTPVRGSRFSAQSVALYAAGHLLAGDQASGLLAAPFDPAALALTGPARPLLSDVYWFYAVHQSYVDVSDDGALLYAPGNPRRRELAWVTPGGEAVPAFAELDAYYFPALSGDGKRAVVAAGADLVVLDLERATRTLLSSHKDDELHFRPIWMPGDQRVLFASNRSGKWNLYARNADGTGQEELILDADFTPYPESCSPAGIVSMSVSTPGKTLDIWTLAPGEEPQPLVTSEFHAWGSRFSPDGTLLAYSAADSGRPEVFVQPLGQPGERLTISSGGGSAPVWSGDGSSLYYGTGDAIWRSRVVSRSPLRFDSPVRVTAGEYDLGNWNRFSVHPQEERFLVVRPRPESDPGHLHIVTDWVAQQELETAR